MARPEYHFFGLPSRLGMLKHSLGQTKLNEGVEEGAAMIHRSLPTWLSGRSEQHLLPFPAPEQIHPDQALEDIAHHLHRTKEEILQLWQAEQTPIFLGGDHSVAGASLAAVLERFDPRKVAVLQFDSHGDLHTPATSPSGNFHGMWLRAVVDTFPHAEIDRLVPQKLPLSQWRLLGNPLLEPEEEVFLSQHHCAPITSQQLQHHFDTVEQNLSNLIEHSDHLHLSFDIDVFAANLVPGTGTPNPAGLTKTEVWRLLDLVREQRLKSDLSWSLDLVEYNPQRDQANRTLALALETLERILS